MTLFILSFIAGVLTIFAPCILPLLPVIIGGALVEDEKSKKPSPYRPLVIAGSLAVSVIVFTLLLKFTTMFLGIPATVWSVISGVIVILLGVYFLKPDLWYRLPITSKMNISSNKLLGKSLQGKGLLSAVLIGLSLGPVFNSCSPTYALVVAGVLPESFARGLLYLIAYAVGMAGALLLVAYGGKAVIAWAGWLSNPHGYVKRIVGIIFIVVGLSVTFGLDKKAQTYILEQGWYDPIGRFERSLE